VTVLSENVKLHLDPHPEKVRVSSDTPSSGDAAQLDDTEAQMRRALGLHDDGPRHRPEPERNDMPQRQMERYAPGAGHRRRFVQDGDVPVTIVRRDGIGDPGVSRPAAPISPSTSRLQRTEAALAAETASRDRAERALVEAQALIRDLQTKIGHAELAKNEALEASRRERETLASLRSAADDYTDQLDAAEQRARAAEKAMETLQEQLDEERAARKIAERSLREAVSAREAAEELLRDLSEEPAPAAVPKRQPVQRIAAAKRPANRAKSLAVQSEVEPEPVKWWLTAKPAGKRR